MDIQRLKIYQPALLLPNVSASAVVVLLSGPMHGPYEMVLARRRAQSMCRYAGDLCLPGGRFDPDDRSLLDTASREVEEEIGLERNKYAFIGRLDDFRDGSGNLVRPYVGLTELPITAADLCPNSAEIDTLALIGTAALWGGLRAAGPRDPATKRRPAYVIDTTAGPIWGLTAAIISHFFNVAEGREHYPIDRLCDACGA